MQLLDVPIIHRTYQLYRALHELDKSVPKAERFTVWQSSKNACLEILYGLLRVGYRVPEARAEELANIAPQVDMLRVFLRLSADVKAIDQKKHLALQDALDEVGRMLGGWLKSARQR